MSVAGIASTSIYQLGNTQVSFSKAKSAFAQLGQDLQSGSLSQAQADFATLQSDLPQNGQNSSSAIGQDFNSLGQALKAGNLTSAQQAFSKVQTDVQNVSQMHGHHHHHGGGGASAAASSAISQDFMQLGQDLQSGNTTTAQQAYSTLQTDLQQYGLQSLSNSSSSSASSTIGSLLSVNG
jgi:hypothetical protein